MNLFKRYENAFRENATRTAFCIDGEMYTYNQFSEFINGTRELLDKELKGRAAVPVGVMCYDSIETFASIFAIWFSGCHFVPLHPLHPDSVNLEKIQQSGVPVILSSAQQKSSFAGTKLLINAGISGVDKLPVSEKSGRAYILFTSGSTGKPKGVPISIENLNAFIDGFFEIYPDLNSGDRFLQTYDLTSDAAFTGYLIPLLLGATVFTISPSAIKYLSIIKLLQGHNVTWTQFTPSVLNYLRPYLQSLKFDSLKHSHFGGEALELDLVREWSKCVPNAEISNIYGPTETTITCTILRIRPDQLEEHAHKNQVSIGKPLKDVKIRIVDETLNDVPDGRKGELCIGGPQVMEGYLQMQEQSCFLMNGSERFYRSGDLVFQDGNGFLMFCGRIDDQLKINGYRIEPVGIEQAIVSKTDGCKCRVFGFRKADGLEALVAFIEKFNGQEDELREKLREVIQPAAVPEKIIVIPNFPLNTNGKVDKSQLFSDYSTLLK